MKVAITIWNDRISPVFDTAGRILVVEIEGGEERSRQEHLLEEIYPPWRVRRLKNLGVEVLICGAVSNPVAALIDSAGIRLVPWVSGD
ncbi:MAG: dinitrogenase iron-molybdenum cofactor biosynthesis domain-containing protein, partial [Candidatus Krumholzibacteria bacterium]|nr:dinitrogenase iron-molybdenum cofactor biosynthesis domain-containing protein [Candidatus Krumholzibacteria bacterium]